MEELARVLVAPRAPTADARDAAIAAAQVGDALRGEAAAPATVELLVGTVEGDLASQHTVERELYREALDRSVMDREEFIARVRDTEAAQREELSAALADAGVVADLEAGRTGSDATARAARTAFVRLFDAGLLERAERVVDMCPRCTTVVDVADSSRNETGAEVLSLELPDVGDGPSVDVDIVEIELLPGVVAVAVPEGHAAAGGTVMIPIAGREVPVVADDTRDAPWLVVPAHDQGALEAARRLGLMPLSVLDDDGVVRADGPLAGQARYAARAAASDLVEAEGVVVGRRETVVDLARCGRCSTPLVPRFGAHWFLRTGDLEQAAADAVRNGDVTVDDPEARERFVGRAGAGGDWCLSHQVWAGQTVPAARCLDCGQLSVSVEPETSCGKCMGELVSTDDVLDARFVAAVWPLAVADWPADDRALVATAPQTVAVATADAVTAWALPAAALGLRLAGVVPFAELACVSPNSQPDLQAEPVIEFGQ
ncbi:MAG TPA: class I tRNA ligase family protein [Acidimicrobiales bacterium]|nr:class I tRNA ligase family protein [Acidimicrobiales bacterium]